MRPHSKSSRAERQARAEKKLHRAIDRYLPKEPDRGAAGRDHPVFRVTVAELGVFRSDQNIATQKELESSGDRRAVHGTDDWNRQGFQLRENTLIVCERFNQLPRVALELVIELQQVAAGGESSALSGHNNGSQRPIGFNLIQHAV
jgi:hypothetical protein